MPQNNYPSSHDIETLMELISIDENIVMQMASWKHQRWKLAKTTIEKEQAIRELLYTIAELSNSPFERIVIDAESHSHYDPVDEVIHLKSDSIITALHELGHHLFGGQEIITCAWSNKLFRRVFPEEDAKLVWEGHLRVKKR